jgi:hypothetical protein
VKEGKKEVSMDPSGWLFNASFSLFSGVGYFTPLEMPGQARQYSTVFPTISLSPAIFRWSLLCVAAEGC